MSKVDAQRAMREARYEALLAQAPAARPSTLPAPPSPRPAGQRRRAKAAATDGPTADATDLAGATSGPADELCGHRSIGNKSCSRPAGHAEKNHRYK